MSEDISVLVGKTVESIELLNGQVTFNVASDGKYKLTYEGDCCSEGELIDVAGELTDLVGSPIVMAELVTNTDAVRQNHLPPSATERAEQMDQGSFTWSFYKFATAKGYVTLSWFGTSNGYYTETVEFRRFP